ncbi:WG repeat-containing protein [bacterium]|nr:WG repeat-containing protein [bacterium]
MRKFLYVLGALAVILLLFVSIKYLTVKSIDESKLDYIQTEKSVGLKRVKQNGKWALLDESNRPITDFEYDYISDFSNDKSEILKNDKYGFIDKNANVIVEPKYDLVFGFNNGVAKVLLNGKYGVVDENGVEIIKPDYYDYISEFDYRGLAKASKGDKTVIIDKSGKVQK